MMAETTVEFDVEVFAEDLAKTFRDVRQPVQSAMAGRFYEIVNSNFGEFGYDRPQPWPALSRPYAQKVNRPFATLYITGSLMEQIRMNNNDPTASTVSVSDNAIPYALVHQYGGGNNIPARPFFPVDQGGNVTPLTRQEVLDVAQRTLEELLS